MFMLLVVGLVPHGYSSWILVGHEV
uniref:Uncharacterized protein n=1 Tax=Arundo donax TaxID=35708 RepID=A0A0A9GJ84_ARUDO